MARQGITDVELVPNGTSLQTSVKGAYVRNMYLKDTSWHVRPGFGQLTQRDSTMGLRDPTLAPQGLKKHLGSKAIVTDFGHTQILSVFTARVFTGSAANQGIWADTVTVQIHDVTANSHWEEVLYRHTAENNPNVSPMPNWRGNYETSLEEDYQSWDAASDSPLFITEFSDHILFGSERLGIWAYTPAMYDGNRRKQVQSQFENTWNLPYSETSVLVRIHPVDGLSARAFPYVNSTDWPNSPHAIASVQGRLAIAAGRDVYFSDLGTPASIITDNIITVTSEQEITALHQVGESLLIFTESETWHYVPNSGDIISKGRLTRISPDIGCLSPSSLCAVGESVFWFDKNGAYLNNGGLNISRLSENIEPFFTSHMTDPLSSYLVDQGVTTLVDEQPRLTYRLAPSTVSCAYDPVEKYVLTAIPDINLMLAFHTPSQSWAMWPLESTASGTVDAPTPSVVGRQSNLPNPWVTVADQRVFLVTGVETHTLHDDAIDGSTRAPLNRDNQTRSYVISELGRGGGLDRSVDVLEDNRCFSGQYYKHDQPASSGDFYLGEPIQLPENYIFPGGIPGTPGYPGGRVRSDTWLVPLHIRPTINTQDSVNIAIELDYDNTEWRVVTRGAGNPIIEVILSPERAGSAEGWGLGVLGPVPGVAECQMYDSGTGLVDPFGDRIKLYWDAPTAAARKAFSYAAMNNPLDTLSPILYLPVQIKDPTAQSMSSFGIAVNISRADGGQNMDFWVFDKSYAHDKHDADDVAQPVDYAMKSAQVGIKDATRIFYRGVDVRTKTRGQADAPIFPDHPWTTMNVAAGSDWNGWTSQIVTHSGDASHIPALSEVLDKLPIRSRVKDTTTGVINPRSFNNPGNTWSDTTATSTGTYLIDEVEVDTLAVSDAVKGEYVSVMIFGMIRSRAESLTLDSVRASLRNVRGGRRRKGR